MQITKRNYELVVLTKRLDYSDLVPVGFDFAIF